ncbi:MAG: Wzz/FepE/Etk N-terminal domain-containing protein [Acidobacteriaceae bacterium]
MDLLATIWKRRRWLAKITGIGALLLVGITFLIPNDYTSTAQLMPPDQQALSSTSMLNALVGSGLNLPSVGSSLLTPRTPSATSIGILGSRTAQDDIIDRFDLRKVYGCKLYTDTRDKLAKRTSIAEDKKSGIIIISVTDHDRYRARDIAQAYVEELDKLVNSLSTSSARRERIFLEQRLKSIKQDLDASSLELSQFSSRNATLDLQKQGEATVEAAGKLQGELIAAESELSGLKAEYTDDNVRVREVQGRINELRSQLQKMSGMGEAETGADLTADQPFPSIRKLPLLGFRYYDLYRQVAMQESLYETLSKQYELAKVEEAKEIPPIKVLDVADVPEKKSSPHRMILVFFGTLVIAIAGSVWAIVSELRATRSMSGSVRSIGSTLMGMMDGPEIDETD